MLFLRQLTLLRLCHGELVVSFHIVDDIFFCEVYRIMPEDGRPQYKVGKWSVKRGFSIDRHCKIDFLRAIVWKSNRVVIQ